MDIESFLANLINGLAIRLDIANKKMQKASEDDKQIWFQVCKDIEKMIQEQKHTLSLIREGII